MFASCTRYNPYKVSSHFNPMNKLISVLVIMGICGYMTFAILDAIASTDPLVPPQNISSMSNATSGGNMTTDGNLTGNVSASTPEVQSEVRNTYK